MKLFLKKLKAEFVISGIIFVLAFLLLLYYIFLSNLPGGKHFGVTFTAVLSFLLFLYGLLLLLKEKAEIPTIVRKVLRYGQYLFCLWLISFFLFIVLLYTNSTQDELSNPDYLVILGAGLNGDVPSLALHERLSTGLHYLQQHPDLPVVVTGGQGPGETIPEAQAMKTFLLANGINKERIIAETKSTSTMENFVFTYDLLEKSGAEKPIKINIVTNDFHILRAKMLAERNGFIAGSISAPTPYYLLPASVFREYFAFVKSLCFDR